jgi:hypothetical protein
MPVSKLEYIVPPASLKQFEEEGYLVLEDIFTDAELQVLDSRRGNVKGMRRIGVKLRCSQHLEASGKSVEGTREGTIKEERMKGRGKWKGRIRRKVIYLFMGMLEKSKRKWQER